MRIDLILPQFVLLDVMYVLAACMQTIHVPLVVSRRMSYNRVAACLYEASLVVHLAIVADILLCSTGNRLLAPPFAIAHALTSGISAFLCPAAASDLRHAGRPMGK